MSEKMKAAEAKWITDRSPTEDDGEIVLTWCHDRWTDMHISRVLNGTVWMRQPPPYQPPPPEPDTSLEASIEFVASMSKTGLTEVERGHVERVIAAAQVYAASREGIDDDPSPEWTDKLIRLCERMTYLRDGAETYWHIAKEIGEHLNKRGEQ